MIDLNITQQGFMKSSDTALEEFKSVLVDMLNNSPEDRFTEKRWSITKNLEETSSQLFYDTRVIAVIKINDGTLNFITEPDIPRFDDVLYAVRFTAERLSLEVYSNTHNGARLPQNYALSLDNTYFQRSQPLKEFFEKSSFIPRYALTGMENTADGRYVSMIYPPFYAENKQDGAIYILNDAMLNFLLTKDNQKISSEFSYKVADSMTDFAKKYDFGLIPVSFYQNYGFGTKIINSLYFDAFHIYRKVFIDPYIWDFDGKDPKFFKNIKNGLHAMDKVRRNENLDEAIKRVIQQELKVAQDYVGARIWGIEFDRDRDGILTPRLKINVFVHGLLEKHKSQDHDWVSAR